MTVTIKNAGLDPLKLQVIIGDLEPAEANGNPRNFSLAVGQGTGPLNFDVFLFYRIANNPASPGDWSAWTEVSNEIESVITV